MGWFKQSLQGDVVSQDIDINIRYWLTSFNRNEWKREYTYAHVLCRTLIAELHYLISTVSNTAWLDHEAPS